MQWLTKSLLCLLLLSGCQRAGNTIQLQPGQSATVSQFGDYDVVGCDWLQSISIQPGPQAAAKIDMQLPPQALTGLSETPTFQSTINGVAEFHEGWQVEINDARKRVVYRGGPLTRTFDFQDGSAVTISDGGDASE